MPFKTQGQTCQSCQLGRSRGPSYSYDPGGHSGWNPAGFKASTVTSLNNTQDCVNGVGNSVLEPFFTSSTDQISPQLQEIPPLPGSSNVHLHEFYEAAYASTSIEMIAPAPLFSIDCHNQLKSSTRTRSHWIDTTIFQLFLGGGFEWLPIYSISHGSGIANSLPK